MGATQQRPAEPPPPHPDETRILEDHEQTAHKLAVMARYPGAWASIIAGAKTRTFRSREMWIVETHAGAGLHLSRDHPDGVHPGTPLLACHAAREVQRRHPGVKVHVRAIDINAGYVQKLQTRVQPFRAVPEGPDHVDVEVYRSDFEDKVQAILDETLPGQCRSFWFVDPYGVAEIPHRALEPLAGPKYGPEVIINLDVGGLWRVSGAAEAAATADKIVARLTPGHRKALDRTYGSDVWMKALRGYRPRRDAFEDFAKIYADTFPAFQHRRVYRLRSSHNQVRFLVHLSHVPAAEAAFEKTFQSTLKMGLFAGRGLSLTERAQAARSFWESYRGTTTSVEQLHVAGPLLLDRGQVKVVCRTADQEGYGKFDETARTMAWLPDRLPPQLTLRMG